VDDTPDGRRERRRFDWSLLGCALSGHVLYSPDEDGLRERLIASGPIGDCWRCLRCAAFVPSSAPAGGPAEDAPLVLRGQGMRDAVILRFFAVERWLRAALCFAAAYLVWRFAHRQNQLQQAFDHGTPLIKQVFGEAGLNLQHSKTLELLQKAVDAKPTTLRWIIVALIAYGVIELVEGIGLWMLKRWGEYFAFLATSLFLPFEIYELVHGGSPLKVVTLLLNLALALYLIISKRLFGVRGGVRAYEESRHAASLLEIERAAGAGRS
jgi:uncharacterized membrane protein (DUF2068 family)